MALNVPLPIKCGVSPNRIWLPKGNWKTVLGFFQSKFPHLTESDCVLRFEREEVVTEQGEILNTQSKYCSEQHIYFYRELKEEIKVPFEEQIIYQNDRILVVDKPHFLPVAPSGKYLHETLLVRLRIKTGIDALELCHRLDRETAGIVLLTKHAKYRNVYHQLFSKRLIKKTYHAITEKKDFRFPLIYNSCLKKDGTSVKMKEFEAEPNSETILDLIEDRKNEYLLKLNPITGKKHQLRVHLASLGLAIKNDPLYPTEDRKTPGDFSKPLQLLAKSIAFIDPVDGKSCFFESLRSL